MKNLIQVELQKLELQIKWVTNMINEAENQGGLPLSVDADTIIDDVLAALTEAQQTIVRARHIVEVPPAVFGEGFDWEFHYKARRNELLKLLGNKEG